MVERSGNKIAVYNEMKNHELEAESILIESSLKFDNDMTGMPFASEESKQYESNSALKGELELT